LRQAAFPIVCSCALAYFGYHTLQGERGLVAYLRITKEAEDARTTLARLEAERKRLEHRVSLLQRDSLDLDLLDERARAVLNYGRPGDLVYYFTDDSR